MTIISFAILSCHEQFSLKRLLRCEAFFTGQQIECYMDSLRADLFSSSLQRCYVHSLSLKGLYKTLCLHCKYNFALSFLLRELYSSTSAHHSFIWRSRRTLSFPNSLLTLYNILSVLRVSVFSIGRGSAHTLFL